MALCRRLVVVLCCVVSAEVLVTQVLAQGNGVIFPAQDASTQVATTTEMGWFKKMFHAAKELVWSDSSNATQPATTTALMLPSPMATRTPFHVYFEQVGQIKSAVKMNFSLRVLNEDLNVAAEPGLYTESSTIRIEARVQADPGLFPKLFLDECYGTDGHHQSQSRRAYIIVNNHGCLYAGDSDATWFRKEDLAIVFTLRVPAFLLDGESEEIYLHCLLAAWSQKFPTSPGKKACYFDRITSMWKNIDEPSKASVCSCCNGYCPSEPHLLGSHKAFLGEGRLHREVVGPLLVRKADVPWFEGQCQTMKKLLLVSVAFVGSCVLAALFVGALLALGLALFRYSQTSKGHRLLNNRKEQPYHTELQMVVEALAVTEEIQKESTLDYCKLKSDNPDTEA